MPIGGEGLQHHVCVGCRYLDEPTKRFDLLARGVVYAHEQIPVALPERHLGAECLPDPLFAYDRARELRRRGAREDGVGFELGFATGEARGAEDGRRDEGSCHLGGAR